MLNVMLIFEIIREWHKFSLLMHGHMYIIFSCGNRLFSSETVSFAVKSKEAFILQEEWFVLIPCC